MREVYSLMLRLVQNVLPLVGLFNKKLKKSIKGREETFAILKKELKKNAPVIWMHAASLGEYEQGVPIIESVSKCYPDHQWVITFFSPSGYEVKKNNSLATATVYLPLDTPSNVNHFLDSIHPEFCFLIKYDFWPNYLLALKERQVRTFLVSGVFRKSQPFFKWYGRWIIKALESFEYFFLQDASSGEALEALGFKNYLISGDTRFDRVSHQIEVDNTLDFMNIFKGTEKVVVCGSTWPECEAFIAHYVNNDTSTTKYVIAPHEIKPEKLTSLENILQVSSVRYSQKDDNSLQIAKVLIVDTIGLLSRIYSYGDIAYVGGAMGGTGLHNILEPATFGIPIIIGTNIEKFPEAKKLRQLAGLYTVASQTEFDAILKKLISDEKFRLQTGMIAGHFVNSNTGATRKITDYLLSKP